MGIPLAETGEHIEAGIGCKVTKRRRSGFAATLNRPRDKGLKSAPGLTIYWGAFVTPGRGRSDRPQKTTFDSASQAL